MYVRGLSSKGKGRQSNLSIPNEMVTWASSTIKNFRFQEVIARPKPFREPELSATSPLDTVRKQKRKLYSSLTNNTLEPKLKKMIARTIYEHRIHAQLESLLQPLSRKQASSKSMFMNFYMSLIYLPL